MKDYLYYFRFCIKLHKSYFILVLISELLLCVLSLTGLIFPKYILDAVFSQYDFGKAVTCTAVFLSVTAIINISCATMRYYAERSRDQMYRKFSLVFAEKIMSGEYCNFENPEYLDTKEKALKCMSGSYGFAGGMLLLAKLIGQAVRLMILISITIFFDLRILPVFAVFIAVNIITDAKLKRVNAELDLKSVKNARQERYFYELSENAEYAKEIRLYGLRDWIVNLYKEQFFNLHKIMVKRNLNSCTGSIVGNISVFLQQAVAYGTLLYKVVDDIRKNTNEITVGGFSMYLSAMLGFNNAVTETLLIVNRIREMKIYADPFRRFMSAPLLGETPVVKNEVHLRSDDRSHSITFEHVCFRYPGQKEYALNDINCEINFKEKLALVGANGAGKSTFIKLIARLYNPEKGKILLDGVDIKTIDRDEYRKLMSFVFQDYKLFAMSIRENVGLDIVDEIDEKEYAKVMKQTGLDEKVMSLKAGLETQIFKIFDSEGFEPSGGEAQKIAIARAFMKKAPMVILDEPTASLDPKSEYRLYDIFDKLIEGKGAIFISHRLASCKKCDRILVFDSGRIVEEGAHERLLDKKGIYADMFMKQANLYV